MRDDLFGGVADDSFVCVGLESRSHVCDTNRELLMCVGDDSFKGVGNE